MSSPDRRRFLSQTAASLGLLATGASLGFDPAAEMIGDIPQGARDRRRQRRQPVPEKYTGPNVILVRFGGGVRRQETVTDPDHTYCPFIYHELGRNQGVIFNNVEIATRLGIDTSHGQGTHYILTGQYRHYEDIEYRFLSDRFEPQSPTLFEYLRRRSHLPEHQALIINGEDRINEEFYTFSNHHQFGVQYRSTVLSLYRFKMFLLREQLHQGRLTDHERRQKELQLRAMEIRDYRVENRYEPWVSSDELDEFWRRWQAYYGSSGLVNPRGDRLLTTLALWALRHLRPRLMMINYQDPDYVHWGIANHYTRAISTIDEGVREIYNAVQADEEYRDRTIFVIVPDCGRDNNRCMSVPYQHHFNTPSAHQIFAVVAGPQAFGIPRPARVNESQQQQISIARTVGQFMDFQATAAEAPSLLERA